MTIFILATVLFTTSCNINTQHFGESDIRKTIIVLYEKKILHTSYDTLFLKLNNFKISEDSLKEININGKKICINFVKQEVPYIIFNQVASSTDGNQVLIRFIIKGGGGYMYRGDISYQLIDGEFKLINCKYLSEVE